jgi:hypothetical protein
VLLGNGDGTFQAQNTFAVGSEPQSIAVADLNGDGNPDLVVTNVWSRTVSVLLGSESFKGQTYTIDQPAQLAFTQPPANTTVGKVINGSTGVQVAVEDSGSATVGIDSSVVTLTLSGGTFADGGTTESVAAVNGVATFNSLIINAAGTYTLTAGDGSLPGATSGSFMICPLGDVNLDGVVNAADIDAVYAHFGDTTGRYDLNGDGVVNQADVDYLVKTILKTGYGDANLDHAVDFLDFQVILNHWQSSGTYPQWENGDFNGDGTVDFLDFQTLLNNWNPGGFPATGQRDPASPSSAAAATAAAAAQVASSAVAVSSADLSAVTAPAISTAPAAASVPMDEPVNLLSRDAAFTSAPVQAASLSSSRTAVRPLRHSTVFVQNDGEDTVDLLTQLHRRPVVA